MLNSVYTWFADLAEISPFLVFIGVLVGIGMALGAALNELRWRRWRRNLRRPGR